MKTRNGFISNSSSSSFLAIYVADKNLLYQIAKLLKIPMQATWEDLEKSENWEDEEGDGIYKHKDSLIEIVFGYDTLSWAGMQIEDALNEDFKLSECKTILQERFKSIGIDIPLDKIRLAFGELNSN